MKSKNYLAWFVIALAGLIIYSFAQNPITGNVVKDEIIVIEFPTTGDFANDKEGTVTLNLAFPEASFKVGEQSADMLVLLKSKTIAGLDIAYYPKEKRLTGGLPTISTEGVSLLDGKMHDLSYTFNKDLNLQSLAIDGNVLVSGKYTGKQEKIPTGATIIQKKTIVRSNIQIQTEFS
ncbi:MAG: hypothetical protein ABIC04_02780 [Nanoarchaeota archaeon]